jgi:cytochrome c biogenesis protein CcmG/thiol:disulfide interchange protein DsbE
MRQIEYLVMGDMAWFASCGQTLATFERVGMSILGAEKMSAETGVSTESLKPQDRVLLLMGRAFEFRQSGNLVEATVQLEHALTDAKASPYEIEFQTRIQLAMSLADVYQLTGNIPKARAMLVDESAFAERISQVIQATGTPPQKRTATSGSLQVRDRLVQISLLGQQAPEISVREWIKGGPVTLAELSGQVVILEFWATWCKPCQEMFPKLIKLHEAERSHGLEVIALTRHYMAYRGAAESMSEERQLMLNMVLSHGVDFHVGIAEDERLQATFGANGLPTLILIDRGGIVRYAGPGEDDIAFNNPLRHCLQQLA